MPPKKTDKNEIDDSTLPETDSKRYSLNPCTIIVPEDSQQFCILLAISVNYTWRKP